MIVYLDSSVLLRIVLREPDPLREWGQITVGVSCAITRVEVARTMDRNKVLRTTNESELTEKRVEISDILSRLDFVPLKKNVLDEAARPLSIVLGTLDSLHLASAVLYRKGQPPDERPLLFATHDIQLARAARAVDFEVIGA